MHVSSKFRTIQQTGGLQVVLATVRTDCNRTESRFASTLPPESEKPKPEALNPVRKDIAMLYTFVGLLSAALPEESVLQFLGQDPLSNKVPLDLHDKESVESISGRLPTFIQRAVWSRSTLMQDLRISICQSRDL